jgi:hypothetical protein
LTDCADGTDAVDPAALQFPSGFASYFDLKKSGRVGPAAGGA